MEVILLEKIHNLGNLGDKVNVKPGYGRNYLIPHNKALPATPENLKDFEAKRAAYEQHETELLANAKERAEKLAELLITIPAMVGDEGKLYGSVGTRDIADAVTNAGVKVEKSEVMLPHGALRYVGDYDIDIQLHGDVTAVVKVNVVAEQ